MYKRFQTWYANVHEFYAPFYKTVGFLLLLNLVVQAFGLLAPVYYGKVIDLLIKHATLGSMFTMAGIALFLSLLQTLFSYFREKVELNNLDFDLGQHSQQVTLRRLLRYSLGQHTSENSGLRLTIINQGEDAVNSVLNQVAYSIIPFLIQTIVTIGAMVWLDPILGLVVFIGVALFIAYTIKLNLVYYPRLRQQREKNRAVGQWYAEILRNIALVKIHAREEDISSENALRRSEVTRSGKAIWLPYSKRAFTRDAISEITRFVVLFLGIIFVAQGKHTPGDLIVFLSWSATAFSQLGSISHTQRQLMQSFENITKYFNMFALPPAIKDIAAPETMRELRGAINFENVSFAYSNTEKDKKGEMNGALRDVSFAIKAGETVALVGHSGAGKTTIVNLLLRAYDPSSGVILVDGHDLRDVNSIEYRERVGFVEQHVELFDETLKYNILFGIPEARRKEAEQRLDEIAKKACIDRFYDRLGEKRFDTIIGEKGVRLSGGERQRVGIARALIKDPHILIFDEATSNLDAESEAVIHDAMREALHGRTGIIIAHRLSTVRDADKIIVLEKGTVVGIGNHGELMKHCPQYKALVERQVTSL